MSEEGSSKEAIVASTQSTSSSIEQDETITEDDDEPKKKKNRPGRSSRRRKRKAKSIMQAAASLSLDSSRIGSEESSQHEGNSGAEEENVTTAVEADGTAGITTSGPVSVVPIDRGFTLEGVKVRRREERKRRNPCIEETPIDDTLLDPKDEFELKSQLGFVPGNAVCVAARLSQDFYEIERHIQPGSLAPPSVVKLYPMVVRESYRGGKSDGRKFKGRRRGGMRKDGEGGSSTNSKNEPTSESTNGDGRKDDCPIRPKEENVRAKNKRERCWVIEERVSPNDTHCNDESNQKDPNGKSPTSSNDHAHQPIKRRQIIEPFPTLYWLTSPFLRTQISQIEVSKQNNVHQMETRLRSLPQYLEQMERAHKSYGKQRWELLTENDRQNVLQRGWGEALGEGRGVAGIRKSKGKGGSVGKWDSVKCLHAHAAHFLAQVAEWEDAKIEELQLSGEERKAEKEASAVMPSQGNIARNSSSMTSSSECDRNDLNLVGKWTIEAVLEAIKTSKAQNGEPKR